MCLFLVLLVLNGCSEDGPSPEKALPDLGPVSVITRDEVIRLPLDHFSPDAKETDDIVVAEEYLARVCMRDFALTYPVRPFRKPSYSSVLHPGLFGLIDPELVPHGYGPANASWDDPRMPFEARPASGVEEDVWLGRVPEFNGRNVPEGGCLAEGRRKLGGTAVLDWPRTELQAEAMRLADADPRTGEVAAAWATCMRNAGHPYATPVEAASDPQWIVPGPVGPAEVAVASADVACKTEVNYAGIRTAVITAYEMRLLTRNKDRLTTHKLELSLRLKNAQDVLARNDVDAL